jgi:hypothetical protein
MTQPAPSSPSPVDPSVAIALLASQLRWHRRLLAVFGLVLAAGMIAFSVQEPQASGGTARFDELTVQRLTVAGPDGVRRYILSHDMPKAPFAGREWERTVPPGMAGLVMLDPKGNEVGGYAASDSHSMLSLDYRDHPLEAVVLGTGKADDGSQAAQILLKQPPTGPAVDMDAVDRGAKKAAQGGGDPNDPDVRELKRHYAMQSVRVALAATQKTAALVLSDAQGRERILLRVDEHDDPAIVVLGPDGKEIARFPEAKK